MGALSLRKEFKRRGLSQINRGKDTHYAR
jgi:hypothetical protein